MPVETSTVPIRLHRRIPMGVWAYTERTCGLEPSNPSEALKGQVLPPELTAQVLKGAALNIASPETSFREGPRQTLLSWTSLEGC